LIKQVKITKFK